MGYSHAAVEAYDPVRAGAGRAETSRADRGNRQEGTGKRARKAGKVSGRFRLKQQRGKFGVNLGKFEVKQTERVMLAEDEQE